MTALVSVEPVARAGTEIQLRAGKAKGQEKRRVLRVSLETPLLLGYWDSCLARSGAVCDLLPVFVGPFFPTAINRASQFVVCVCSAEQSGVIGFVLAPEILLPESVFTLLCTLERGGEEGTQLSPCVPIAFSGALGNSLILLTHTSAPAPASHTCTAGSQLQGLSAALRGVLLQQICYSVFLFNYLLLQLFVKI